MKMPVLFIGHGSPMNAIEKNEYTNTWIKIKEKIPKPTAILSISAHWYVRGTRVLDDNNPRMIYDMYGFPKELYEVNYKAIGSPKFARLTRNLISKDVSVDNSWGYDHGTWAVLNIMYPSGDIPVYQLSIDSGATFEEHFKIGEEIRRLREEGVLILGSGNVVHNLSRVDFSKVDGYDFAIEFDEYIKNKIINRNYDDVINYEKAGKCSKEAFYTPEHFVPLLYILGASNEEDILTIYNDSFAMGSLSMTSYLFE